MCRDMIYARLFGDFRLFYENKEICFGKKTSSRNLKLLQIMFLHKEEGISRGLLLEYLYGKEDIVNISNNFRVTLHRLRKQIQDAGMPEGEYIVSENAGRTFRWDPQIEVQTDVELFDQTICQAEKETDPIKKAELLEKCCSLYEGELLESIGLEDWVVVLAVGYKEKYECALRQLIEFLEENHDYEKMLDLCKRASELYPYDEWQEEQIECLMRLGRYQEAFEVCKRTSKMYFTELGVTVSPRMVEQFRKISGKILNPTKMAMEIQGQLREEIERENSSYMDLPSFIDSYQMIEKICWRTGNSGYLMICTIQSVALREREKLRKMSCRLKSVIPLALREGDVYTRYSDTQYLILMAQISKEESEHIFQNIQQRFTEHHRMWRQNLDYCIAPILPRASDRREALEKLFPDNKEKHFI